MKHLRLAGLSLMAIVVLAVAGSSAAQAATFTVLPEKLKFTAVGGVTDLRALGGKELKCANIALVGEYTSARLGNAEVKFTKCEVAGLAACTGLNDTTSGNITEKDEFHLRHALNEVTKKPTENVTGVFLMEHVHFSCLGILFLELGCISSDNLEVSKGGGTAVNKLQESIYGAFLETGGDASVKSIDTDNSLGMETCEVKIKESAEESKAYESAGTKGEGTGEKYENSGKEKVTELIDLSGEF